VVFLTFHQTFILILTGDTIYFIDIYETNLSIKFIKQKEIISMFLQQACNFFSTSGFFNFSSNFYINPHR
jgi:hypothetical protein